MGEQQCTYKTSFERAFLKQSREFYENESRELLIQVDAPTFLRKIQQRLDEESTRSQSYLFHTTEPLLTKLLEETLITNHLSSILDHPASGLSTLISDSRISDLQRLYTLFGRVTTGRPALQTGISKWIVATGNKVNAGLELVLGADEEESSLGVGVEDLKGKGKAREGATMVKGAAGPAVKGKSVNEGAAGAKTKAALAWVQNVLDLKGKFDTLLAEAFASDKAMEKSINDAFIVFVNKNLKSPEYISLFVDENLKKGLKGKTEAEVDSVLNKTIALFRFLVEKDVFEKYYNMHLAKRLINSRSVSDDAERNMLAKFKIEAGAAFTKSAEGMMKDIKTSEEALVEYKRYLDRTPADRPPFEMAPIICGQNNWPVANLDTGCTLPPILLRGIEAYQNFYGSKHSGRKLQFRSEQGSVEVKVKFKARTHDINLSTHAFVVLALFEGTSATEELSFKDLLAATQMPLAELKRTLQTLACAKFKVLTKRPKGRDVSETDFFGFNDDFVCPITRIKITMVANKVETAEESKETEGKIEDERRTLYDNLKYGGTSVGNSLLMPHRPPYTSTHSSYVRPRSPPRQPSQKLTSSFHADRPSRPAIPSFETPHSPPLQTLSPTSPLFATPPRSPSATTTPTRSLHRDFTQDGNDADSESGDEKESCSPSVGQWRQRERLRRAISAPAAGLPTFTSHDRPCPPQDAGAVLGVPFDYPLSPPPEPAWITRRESVISLPSFPTSTSTGMRSRSSASLRTVSATRGSENMTLKMLHGHVKSDAWCVHLSPLFLCDQSSWGGAADSNSSHLLSVGMHAQSVSSPSGSPLQEKLSLSTRTSPFSSPWTMMTSSSNPEVSSPTPPRPRGHHKTLSASSVLGLALDFSKEHSKTLGYGYVFGKHSPSEPPPPTSPSSSAHQLHTNHRPHMGDRSLSGGSIRGSTSTIAQYLSLGRRSSLPTPTDSVSSLTTLSPSGPPALMSKRSAENSPPSLLPAPEIKRGRSTTLETFSAALRPLGSSVLHHFGRSTRKDSPLRSKPKPATWESLISISISCRIGEPRGWSANRFLLGLRSMQRGGTKPWDPRSSEEEKKYFPVVSSSYGQEDMAPMVVVRYKGGGRKSFGTELMSPAEVGLRLCLIGVYEAVADGLCRPDHGFNSSWPNHLRFVGLHLGLRRKSPPNVAS
ncbi:hypothetical protein P7C70_g1265, partial [Phenoliferia sp. Uapishka_3]